MNELNALPPKIAVAVEQIAAKQAPKGGRNVQLQAQLRVLNDLPRAAKEAQYDLVQELRKDQVENTWAVIAELTGTTVNGAFARYAPKPEKSQISDESEGLNISQAARALGTYAPSIYTCIERNPEADWFVTVKTGGGKRPEAKRIVNLEALSKALELQGSTRLRKSAPAESI